MVTDDTQHELESADTCQGTSDRLLTWSGRGLSSGSDEARTWLKLKVTSAAPTSTRAASLVKLHP